jgi:hypothetical protein
VNAQPDGTFKLKLPLGEYRVTLPTGLSPAFVLKSITYGSANLLAEPLRISGNESSEIQVGFGATSSKPFVRVSGSVLGFDPAQGPFSVGLESDTTSSIEAPVNPDGSFQFRSVLQRTVYTARLVPANSAATSPRVVVEDKDVEGVEIAVPGEREVPGTVTIEGSGVLPGFQLALAATSGSMSVLVKPESNGTFRIKLPTDERRVRVMGLPIGYFVKAINYGSSDLTTQPLKAAESSEMRIILATDPEARQGSVQGRVTGLASDHGGVQLVLNGVAAFSVFESTVDRNGNFTFSDVPHGAYALSLSGAVTAVLSPSSIVVDGDQSGLEVSATPTNSTKAESRRGEEPLPGATVSDLGDRGPDAASESAAVAGMRTINTAEVTYMSVTGGKFGSVPALIGAGLVTDRFLGPVSGFLFSVIVVGKDYAVAAVPITAEAGRYAFYSTPDGVIRYSTSEFLAPVGRVGLPVQ